MFGTAITSRSRAAMLAGAALVLSGATLVGPAASSADAAPRNGVCEAGEVCFSYGAGQGGSRVDLVSSRRSYNDSGGCVRFISAGAGKGACLKNNAGSVWNRTGKPVFVFFNTDFGSTYDKVPPGAKVNLNDNVRKDNASHIIGDAELRFPLRTTQAHIKAKGWCWNSKTNCHHSYNAADIFAGTGTPVVSPVNGTVKSVNRRSSGVGSTVTVKDGHGRLWYFAHMHHSPGPVVTTGQRVSKGTRIGTVGTSAHALGTPSHLHLDMRVGVDSRVSCTASACSRYGFVNNQPLLRTAFLG